MNRIVALATLVETDRRQSEMARRHLLASIALVGLLVLSMVGTNLLIPIEIGASDTGGDTLRQILVLGVCALLAFAHIEYPGTRPPMAMPVTFWLVLSYCALSLLWAVDPMIALRRLVLTGLGLWIVVRAVGDLGAVRALNLLRWTLVALIAISYFAVYFTSIGIHGAELGDPETVAGSWRGVFSHKNNAGPVVAITILLFLFDRRTMPWLVCLPVLVLSGFFLYKTGSKTSMLVLPAAIVVGVATSFYNPRYRSVVGAILLAVLFGLVLTLFYSAKVAQILDDPGAFTGRGRIWQILLQYTQENLWRGAGFGSFWQIGPASPVYRYDNSWVSRYVSEGHNGYLDLVATIGLPGMLLVIASLLLWPAFKLLSARQIGRNRRAILAAIMAYCIMHNLTESTLMGRIASVHVILVLVVVLIHHLAAQSDGWHQDVRHRLVQNWNMGRARLLSPASRRPAMGRASPGVSSITQE
jgi:O-antigen ligase